MDASVIAAMRRWPDVPDCHGWLALDARGTWWLHNHGGPAAPAVWPRLADGRLDKADAGPVLHRGLAEFIGRNYGPQPGGAWAFQNGPQRVYVSLEAAPWILRLQAPAAPDAPPSALTHTGLPATPQSAWLDDQGRVWFATDRGPALLHSLDMPLLAELVNADGDALRWGESVLALAPLPAPPATFFGFRPDPAAPL